jgi:Putative Ig domain
MLKKCFFLLLLLTCMPTAFAKSKASGNLFSLSYNNSSNIESNITLCLNAKGVISCQDYWVKGYTIDIKTTIPNHVYPLAGIRVNNSTLSLGESTTSQCKQILNGFCIFTASATTPTKIYLVDPNGLTLSPAMSTSMTGTTTQPFKQDFVVIGGIPPYTWEVTNTLPTFGSSFSFNTHPSVTSVGILTGSGSGNTIPASTTLGTYTLTVKVTDSQQTAASITNIYPNFIINGNLDVTPSNPNLGEYATTTTFSTQVCFGVSNTTSTTAITYSATSLPPGLSIDASSGCLSGTLTAGSEIRTYPFTVTATQGSNTGSRTYNLTFTGTLTLYPPSLTALTMDYAPSTINSEAIQVTNYTGAYVNYTFTGGPDNFIMSPNPSITSFNDYLSYYQGIPKQVGYYTVFMTASGVAAADKGTATYYLTIPGPFYLTPGTFFDGGTYALPNTTQGSTLTQSITANVNATDIISWSYGPTTGNLPSTFSLSASGNPATLSVSSSTPGLYYFTITATDISADPSSGQQQYSINFLSTSLTLSPTSATYSGQVNQSFTSSSAPITVTGCGSGGCQLTATGLPSFIQLSTNTISGNTGTFYFQSSSNPTTSATYNNITVTAKAGAPSTVTGSGNYSIQITSPLTLSPNSASVCVDKPPSPFGTSYKNFTITATNPISRCTPSNQNAQCAPGSNNTVLLKVPIASFSGSTTSSKITVTDTLGNTVQSGLYKVTTSIICT